MFSKVGVVWTGLVVGVMVALTVLPAAAQSSSSLITVTILPVQRLEGATSLAVSADIPSRQDQLVVKSNTPWILVAHVSGHVDGVAWRIVGQSTWQRLGDATPILQGLKGVHPVNYEVKMDPGTQGAGVPALVTFSVEQAGAH
ncbi:MAG TPA: hypothetical protein VNA31_06905 [bacterium]|nr:hypothetical protein [bacterium]